MKFRKKPVEVEAVQFTKEMAEGLADPPTGVRFCHRSVNADGHFSDCLQSYATHENESLRTMASYDPFHRHVIETLEGTMAVNIGDWIITGVNGERYPCKPDIFDLTYEAIEWQMNFREYIVLIGCVLAVLATWAI